MPDTNDSPSGDNFGNEICQIPRHEGFVPPSALFTERECKGRVFLRHGHPSTTRMDSGTYVPIIYPPIKLFDGAGRVFRLDLLEPYVAGESIRYCIDYSSQTDLDVKGVDYIEELHRNPQNDNSAAQEKFNADLGHGFTLPPIYGPDTANVASRVGNSGKLSR